VQEWVNKKGMQAEKVKTAHAPEGQKKKGVFPKNKKHTPTTRTKILEKNRPEREELIRLCAVIKVMHDIDRLERGGGI